MSETKTTLSVAAKLKHYLKEHENIAQIIKYTIFSMLAFIVEYVSFTILVLLLKGYTENAIWWIFEYTTENGGMGAMIAFFVSVVLAQITAFIVNRKKTFKATNNLAFSIITYALMVCGIIIFNTWAGAAITNSLSNVINNITVNQYIGKLVGSFVAFVVTFFVCKFVIMRRVDNQDDSEILDAEKVSE